MPKHTENAIASALQKGIELQKAKHYQKAIKAFAAEINSTDHLLAATAHLYLAKCYRDALPEPQGSNISFSEMQKKLESRKIAAEHCAQAMRLLPKDAQGKKGFEIFDELAKLSKAMVEDQHWCKWDMALILYDDANTENNKGTATGKARSLHYLEKSTPYFREALLYYAQQLQVIEQGSYLKLKTDLASFKKTYSITLEFKADKYYDLASNNPNKEEAKQNFLEAIENYVLAIEINEDSLHSYRRNELLMSIIFCHEKIGDVTSAHAILQWSKSVNVAELEQDEKNTLKIQIEKAKQIIEEQTFSDEENDSTRNISLVKLKRKFAGDSDSEQDKHQEKIICPNKKANKPSPKEQSTHLEENEEDLMEISFLKSKSRFVIIDSDTEEAEPQITTKKLDHTAASKIKIEPKLRKGVSWGTEPVKKSITTVTPKAALTPLFANGKNTVSAKEFSIKARWVLREAESKGHTVDPSELYAKSDILCPTLTSCFEQAKAIELTTARLFIRMLARALRKNHQQFQSGNPFLLNAYKLASMAAALQEPSAVVEMINILEGFKQKNNAVFIHHLRHSGYYESLKRALSPRDKNISGRLLVDKLDNYFRACNSKSAASYCARIDPEALEKISNFIMQSILKDNQELKQASLPGSGQAKAILILLTQLLEELAIDLEVFKPRNSLEQSPTIAIIKVIEDEIQNYLKMHKPDQKIWYSLLEGLHRCISLASDRSKITSLCPG